MKTKISSKVRSFTVLPLLAVWGLFSHLACTAEFETECPEGMVQKGGGDVDVACIPADAAGAAGAVGGGGGESGSGAGQSGQGVSGGGQTAVCMEGSTRCLNDTQETCGADGQWGAAKGCDIQCDASGSVCVVPVQFSLASETTCAVLTDGTVRCWGSNRYGQLGIGSSEQTRIELKPSAVPGVGNVKSVAGDLFNLCLVTFAGSAYCWGDNSYEQVAADPNKQNALVPSPALFEEQDFFEVDAGRTFVCAVRNGAVSCRGARGQAGSLGDGNVGGQSSTFVQVQGIGGGAKAVKAGGSHSCALSEGGDVYCWGTGTSGQVGQGLDRENSSVALKVQGDAVDIVRIVSGDAFSCALRKDERVVCWGDNLEGELGRGHDGDYTTGGIDNGTATFVAELSSVIDIAATTKHACALKRDGSVWCWGDNSLGALGNDCSSPPCRIDVEQGRTYSHTPMQVPIAGVKSVAAGNGISCALTNEDSVYCWGRNTSGQLGNGEVSVSETPTPTRVLWK